MLVCLEATGADFLAMTVGKSSPLEVGLSSDIAGWVELGRTDTV